jgi:hypothetical protein
MMNPRLRCGIKRRHSTVFVLEEYGHQIELIFTSMRALEQLADSVDECAETLMAAAPATEWWNPRVPADRRRPPEHLDLLHEESLLETPEFVRRRAVAVRRVSPPAKPPAAGG